MRNSLYMHMKRKGHLPGYIVSPGGVPPQEVDMEMDVQDEEELEGSNEPLEQNLMTNYHSNGSPAMNSSTDEPSSTHASTDTPSPGEGLYSPELEQVNGVTPEVSTSTLQPGKSIPLETEGSYSGVQTIVTQVSVEEEYQSSKHKVTLMPVGEMGTPSSQNQNTSATPPRRMTLPVSGQSGQGTTMEKKTVSSAAIFNSSSPDQEGYLFKCSTCSKVYTKRNSVYVHQHRKGHKGNVVRLKATDVQIVSDGDGFSLKSPLPSLQMTKPSPLDTQPRLNGPAINGQSLLPSPVGNKPDIPSYSLMHPQRVFEDTAVRHHLPQLTDQIAVSYPPRTMSAAIRGRLIQPYSSTQLQSQHQQLQKHLQQTRSVPDTMGIHHRTDKLPNETPHPQSSSSKQSTSAMDLFKCPKCHKTYSSPGALIAHNRDTHCELCFKCNDCGKVYWFKNSLLTHQKRKNHSGCTKIAADIQGDATKSSIQSLEPVESTNPEPSNMPTTPEASNLPILPTIGPNFLSTKWEVPTRDSDAEASDNAQYVVIPVVAPLNQTLSAYPQFTLLPPTAKRKRPRTRITEEELVLARKVETVDASCQTDHVAVRHSRPSSNVGLQTDRILTCTNLSSVQVQTTSDLPSTCVSDLLDLGTQTDWHCLQQQHNVDDLLDFGTQTPFLQQTDHASQTTLY